MLELHEQLRPFVADIANMSFDDFLLSPAIERKVDVLFTKLGEVNDVITNFQANDCTVRKAQTYFYLVLEAFLSSRHY